MVRETDYLIVGSGLTGATIARTLHDAGKRVLVLDRRSHLGGNVHDHVHESGLRVHTYGPHYFRTNSERIWKFVNRFAEFYRYEARLKTLVDGKYENWPIAGSCVRRMVGTSWTPGFVGEPTDFEEASLAMMPRLIYEKFIQGYSEKQWGVPPTQLAAALARRFDVREDDDPRLVKHRYQGIPKQGYAGFMRDMLQGIPFILNFDYLRHRDEIKAQQLLVFTGPIDEFFSFDMGRLHYRGQKREHTWIPDVDFAQPCGQVNNPDLNAGAHIRTLEWKHLMPPAKADEIHGTLLTREVTVSPTDPNHYEYPFPDETNRVLFERYQQRAGQIPNLLICGRLGEYRYYDMDQAIGRAMSLVEKILNPS